MIMNTLQVGYNLIQIIINVLVIWHIWRLYGRIRNLKLGADSMQGSLDERVLNQAEYDAMADEQKDANQADYQEQRDVHEGKDSAES